MKTEITTHRVLIADDGMVLTNGDTFGKKAALPLSADASVWREITEAEAQEIITRMEGEIYE